jgi:hypothetical protein
MNKKVDIFALESKIQRITEMISQKKKRLLLLETELNRMRQESRQRVCFEISLHSNAYREQFQKYSQQ